MTRKGICVAGNMIVDITYPIDVMPKSGELVSITADPIRTTGGAVNNVIVDLAKLDPALPLQAVGRIGDDGEGKLTMDYLGRYKNIDTSCVKVDGITSFTLVMSENISRQRTFFTCGGAGDKLSPEDFDWDKISCEIFHIGYILLLKGMDREDPQYGTVMARLLAEAKAHGLKTSIDVVSEASDRFKRLVPPAMKYTDYCVINEIEAQATTGVLLREADETFHGENMKEALLKMKALGVSTWAVIHCPEGGWGLDENNNFFYVPSYRLPKEFIKGKVGAGDAFCAGVLLAAQQKKGLEEAIAIGNAVAAVSLREPGATEGMTTLEEVLEICRQFPKAE